jgi:hypothetical protein
MLGSKLKGSPEMLAWDVAASGAAALAPLAQARTAAIAGAMRNR